MIMCQKKNTHTHTYVGFSQGAKLQSKELFQSHLRHQKEKCTNNYILCPCTSHIIFSINMVSEVLPEDHLQHYLTEVLLLRFSLIYKLFVNISSARLCKFVLPQKLLSPQPRRQNSCKSFGCHFCLSDFPG